MRWRLGIDVVLQGFPEIRVLLLGVPRLRSNIFGCLFHKYMYIYIFILGEPCFWNFRVEAFDKYIRL